MHLLTMKEEKNGSDRSQQINKDYNHGRGIYDVTFEVNKGETLGFLGPNGAGKSTTMRHLMGICRTAKRQCENIRNGLPKRLCKDSEYGWLSPR